MQKYCLLLLIIAITFPIQILAQEHEHHGSNAESLALNHGKKWEIDDSLHSGITQIKQQIATNLSEIHHNKFTLEQYQKLAHSLQKPLNYIFENCRLPAAADAQLHILLSGVIQGITKMKSNSDNRHGAVLVIQALQNYPVFFNDPNWESLNH